MTTPLIIAYFDGDPSVTILSNFAKTPFTLDGHTYHTVEAFWQSLKFSDEIMRSKVRSLPDGLDAKQIGKFAPSASVFDYEGQLYRVGSKEHHILLERAIRAKVAQNESVQTALLNTGDRPLRHMFKNRYGQFRPGDSPRLPAFVFENILTTIREELRSGTFVSELPLPVGVLGDEDDNYMESFF